ncbi:ER membrane protein complex subunit 8/9 homolog [Anabrus simplex]|uniref:ER membrane protein complex subunit 8/9 homolog n=1 Tax=Anabrus simplex TaxID=316456 RepID=UPI0034DD613D
MADIRISARAYSKIMLHAAKYPHCAINGVLLAEDIKSKDDKKGKRLYIVDAIPLFHLCLQVSPMVEIALTQIDHMASKNGLVIAGYYLGNENIRDLSYEKAGHRIADKIAENFSNACLIVVDNQRLSLNMDNIALCLSQYSEGKWKPKDRSSYCVEGNSLDTTATLLQQRVQDELVDFDNHLDDISLDWKNLHINKIVDTVMETYG